MKELNSFEWEAKVLTRYLINRNPTEKAVSLYAEANQYCPIELTQEEQSKWHKALRFPFLLQFIDAGFALRKKPSSFRKKIILMFAILESLPEFSNYFLPEKRNNSLLIIFLIACKAAMRAGIGTLLLWIL